jgi:SAM-dependent methyltransferase
MSLLDQLHGNYVFARRTRVLAHHLAALLPKDAAVLDVGCGDGSIAKLIMDQRPDVRISGIDIKLRPHTHIPVTVFDGFTIPFPDGAFDAVMFVDVLHHTEDPMVLLREARRAARRAVVIKDHNQDGLLAETTLKFMDWVGNARHGVVLPYNYWPGKRWQEAFQELKLRTAEYRGSLGLYPGPANWLFGRGLHFVARLEPKT